MITKSKLSNLGKIKRLINNIIVDLKYGEFLGGVVESKHEEAGAYVTANSDYSVLPYLFDGLIEDDDILVDVGCGKGRVINWWLERGLKNQIIGVEINEEIAESTRKRLNEYKNVSVVGGSIFENFPKNATIFYLFNPFNEEVLKIFSERLKKDIVEKRKLRVVYYNCIHKKVFEKDNAFAVTKLNTESIGPYHEAVIVTFSI